MSRSSALSIVRAAVGVGVLATIAVQMSSNMGAGTFNPTRFFAFFTIESNLYGAILFLFLAARRSASGSVGLDLARGASVVYLTVTFFVVIFLLSGADLQVAIPWVDAVLHKIFPVIVVLDWLVDPPAHRLTFRQALTWLIFPLAWVAFTLIRGAVEGWYPYPFLNPTNGGYGSVPVTSAAILIGFLIIAAVVVALGNFARTWSSKPA